MSHKMEQPRTRQVRLELYPRNVILEILEKYRLKIRDAVLPCLSRVPCAFSEFSEAVNCL